MNWKHCILVGLIFFGIGFLLGFVVGSHPTLESMKGTVISNSLIVLGFLVGLLGRSDILGLISNYFKEKTEKEEREKSNRLKEIDNQLLNIYLPMEKAIEDYKASDPNLITISDLDGTLREIKAKNIGTFDAQVMSFSIEFSRSPSRQTLDNFLVSVNYKIHALKKERKQYL